MGVYMLGFFRLLALGVLLLLAACQTLQGGSGAASPGAGTAGNAGANAGPAPGHAATADTASAVAMASDGAHAVAPNRQAENLRIFLADTSPRPGWRPVSLKPSGMLYILADAILQRSDLMGIQAATDQKGGGILVLILNDDGFEKVRAATAANPGLRLALVVGQTLLAAPAYAAPIQQQQLAFAVGTARNAEIAARSVAGVHHPRR